MTSSAGKQGEHVLLYRGNYNGGHHYLEEYWMDGVLTTYIDSVLDHNGCVMSFAIGNDGGPVYGIPIFPHTAQPAIDSKAAL